MQMTKRSAFMLSAIGAALCCQGALAAVPAGSQPGASSWQQKGDDGVVQGLAAPGAWSENRLYRFRLERIEPCGGEAAGALRGATSWVGAFFTVQAKEPEFFVTPRDVELRRGGVILSATFVKQPTLPGCKPVLNAKRLRANETVSGFALFEVPKDFRVKTADPIVVVYSPSRWGGARRAEVPIPECLDACSRPWVEHAEQRSPGASHRKF
jgi:hypothetical protein